MEIIYDRKKKIYKRYQNIKRRCYDTKSNSYKYYGAKGIKVCDEWLGKNGFYNFLDWALANGYKEELQIDRINVKGNYCPENCRWVDRKTNMRNRTNSLYIDGKPLIEVAVELNIKYATLANRYKKYGGIEKPKKQCVECGKEFYAYRSNQKYCSKKCCDKYNKINNKFPCFQNK